MLLFECHITLINKRKKLQDIREIFRKVAISYDVNDSLSIFDIYYYKNIIIIYYGNQNQFKYSNSRNFN